MSLDSRRGGLGRIASFVLGGAVAFNVSGCASHELDISDGFKKQGIASCSFDVRYSQENNPPYVKGVRATGFLTVDGIIPVGAQVGKLVPEQREKSGCFNSLSVDCEEVRWE